TARMLSALKKERVEAKKVLKGPAAAGGATQAEEMIACLHDALYASNVCSYAQGMALIAVGSENYNWNIDLSETARIWKGGCIIRAELLEKIRAAFARRKDLPNLLVDSEFGAWIVSAQSNWRKAITFAQELGIAIPALSASLAYFDSYRSDVLPQNLTQAQRDFFGAHTYERVDQPERGFVHTEWQELIKEKSATRS
ncbi:MAG TPA: hypothetical protein V6D17_17885, partial [Candidatus Obscuribacterales bacterium]